jgi:hypothetical protein
MTLLALLIAICALTLGVCNLVLLARVERSEVSTEPGRPVTMRRGASGGLIGRPVPYYNPRIFSRTLRTKEWLKNLGQSRRVHMFEDGSND